MTPEQMLARIHVLESALGEARLLCDSYRGLLASANQETRNIRCRLHRADQAAGAEAELTARNVRAWCGVPVGGQ